MEIILKKSMKYITLKRLIKQLYSLGSSTKHMPQSCCSYDHLCSLFGSSVPPLLTNTFIKQLASWMTSCIT